MTQVLTGTYKINRYLEPHIEPDTIVNNSYFLEYVTRIGSKHDIVAIFTRYFDLQELINHSDKYVRKIVAEQGYGLDVLINDKDEWVRQAVALQGYSLNKLINDKHWGVRMAVAMQGYGIDKLSNDSDESVRYEARKWLKK